MKTTKIVLSDRIIPEAHLVGILATFLQKTSSSKIFEVINTDTYLQLVEFDMKSYFRNTIFGLVNFTISECI